MNEITKNIKFLAATAAFAACLTSAQAQTVIVDDNVESNGDASAITGTITNAWAGFGFTLDNSSAFFTLLADPTGFSGGFADNFPTSHPNIATVTYGGVVAAGTYTFDLLVVNPNNGVFLPIQDLSLAGESASLISNPAPVSGGESVWSYELVVADGATIVGDNLDLAINAYSGIVAFQNSGVDHVTISYSPVPEPSSFALIGGLLALGSVMMRRRSV